MAGAGAAGRFCWRERTERLNWRMLKDLELVDVVRRGDPTLLEPFALHVTFARLPVVLSSLRPDKLDLYDEHRPGGRRVGDERNAWFLVRVLQLSMEYLLFLRARDGAVVDSLREELVAGERECAYFAERAKKWKERCRSGDRQVEKLHQVLQSIAKLLQLEGGATPSAVETIERLLSDLMPKRRRAGDARGGGRAHGDDEPADERVITEARVCGLCGKMFSSQGFLDKHLVRRHAGENKELSFRPPQPKASREPHHQDPGVKRQGDGRSSNQLEVNAMLRQVELTLQEQQAQLRALAQEEADKIHSLYDQLHVETQLTDDLRKQRLTMERELDAARKDLDELRVVKADAVEEVEHLKEQIQFLKLKHDIEVRNGVSSVAPSTDPTLALEIRRLEETLTVVNEALATSRGELQRLQEAQLASIKEKHALEGQLHEVQNHAQRLELSLRAVKEVVPVMKRDVGSQTLSPEIISVFIQTDTPSGFDGDESIPKQRVSVVECGVQTLPPPLCITADTEAQTDPIVASAEDQMATVRREESQTKYESKGEKPPSQESSSSVIPDSVFMSDCEDVMRLVQQRAHRESSALASARQGKVVEDKIYVSLPRRQFLTSRFQHEESQVRSRIESNVQRLMQISQRYGVRGGNSNLSTEHLDIVQQALHAHLEILPAEVLERMVAVERTVNHHILQHWLPREHDRRQALDQLQSRLRTHDNANQDLVSRAMATFRSSNVPTSLTTEVQPAGNPSNPPAIAIEPVREAQATPTPMPTSDNPTATGLVEKYSRDEPTADAQSPSRNAYITLEAYTPAPVNSNDPGPRATGGSPSVGEGSLANARSPSPMLVVEQAPATIRSVKVVSVSPKSSPPKSPPSMAATTTTEKADSKDVESMASSHVVVPSIEGAGADEEITGTVFSAVTEVNNYARDQNATMTSSAIATPSPTDPPQTPARANSFTAQHNRDSEDRLTVSSRYDRPSLATLALDDSVDTDERSGISRFSTDIEGPPSVASDYSHAPSDRESLTSRGDSTRRALRWSSSVGASDRSLSFAASSDLSLDSSLPSLGDSSSPSEQGARSSHPHSSVEELPALEGSTEGTDKTLPPASTDVTTVDGGISPILEDERGERSSDDGSGRHSPPAGSPRNSPSSGRRLSPQATTVITPVAFDDSDIEEVMLT